jgi:hypothetical protein
MHLEDQAMRRTKVGISPSVDVMEPRLLLSTAAPFLSEHALSGVVRDVRAIMGTLARTEDTVQASAQLTKLSSRIPSGPEGLAPTWQGDIGLYRPHSASSIITTERRILGDLYRYVQGGFDGGNAPVTGSGSSTSTTPGQGTGGTATPVPASSPDSVRIQNTTGLALLVTVHLEVPQVQQPWITETIPAQGSSIVPFDFGTATNAFMTIDVSLADGGQTPPPLTNLSLSQPMSGYNGDLFSISLIGPYFNVTPL